MYYYIWYPNYEIPMSRFLFQMKHMVKLVKYDGIC